MSLKGLIWLDSHSSLTVIMTGVGGMTSPHRWQSLYRRTVVTGRNPRLLLQWNWIRQVCRRKTNDPRLGVVAYLVGRGGALVETMTFNRRVVGSTPSLAVT